MHCSALDRKSGSAAPVIKGWYVLIGLALAQVAVIVAAAVV